MDVKNYGKTVRTFGNVTFCRFGRNKQIVESEFNVRSVEIDLVGFARFYACDHFRGVARIEEVSDRADGFAVFRS